MMYSGLFKRRIRRELPRFVLLVPAFLLLASMRAAQPPPIEIAISGTQNVKLSWPDAPTQIVLESASTLSNRISWNPLNAAALIENGRRTVTIAATLKEQYFRLRGDTGPALTTIIETSPANGEAGVSVNRETVLRFSQPLP